MNKGEEAELSLEVANLDFHRDGQFGFSSRQIPWILQSNTVILRMENQNCSYYSSL